MENILSYANLTGFHSAHSASYTKCSFQLDLLPAVMAADDTIESQKYLGTQHDPLPLINSRVLAFWGWMLLKHHNLLSHLAETLTVEWQFPDSLYPSYFSLIKIGNGLVRGF